MDKKFFLKSAVMAAAGWAVAVSAQASPSLIAVGSLSNLTDLSGLSGTLENGVDPANVFSGGSALAWAGGNTFITLPDRGPNATAWNASLDNTVSYISRFNTISLSLSQAPSGSLPWTLSASLQSTTLLSSATPLNYGAASTILGGVNYFNGRSDNFGSGNSLNPNDARLDPEGLRVSNDGTKVYISDEYGPYVYEFDRATGQRTRTFTLPSYYGVSTLSSVGATEISSNSTGRVANKGMEGLAISPDGTTLFGFMQSPLAQDGGDGGRMNRIIKIDIATGVTHEFAYDNRIGSKNFNSSELLALNNNDLLVLERDGKGLGDGTLAATKQIYKVSLGGANEITGGLSGEANLLTLAPGKTLFLDIKSELNSKGITSDQIPAKLEGMAFGDDIQISGTTFHTLYVSNDNDFVPGTSGPNKYFVFAVSDADLGGSNFVNQAIPEPSSALMLLGGLSTLGLFRRRR